MKKGFGGIEIIVILAILALVGVGAYVFTTKDADIPSGECELGDPDCGDVLVDGVLSDNNVEISPKEVLVLTITKSGLEQNIILGSFTTISWEMAEVSVDMGLSLYLVSQDCYENTCWGDKTIPESHFSARKTNWQLIDEYVANVGIYNWSVKPQGVLDGGGIWPLGIYKVMVYNSSERPSTQILLGESEFFEIVKPNFKANGKICEFTEVGNQQVGYGEITGYYNNQVERKAWGETKLCDNFIIVDGCSEMITSEVDLNLLQLSSEQDINRILTSSIDAPIRIGAYSGFQYGKGAPACFALYTILEVIR